MWAELPNPNGYFYYSNGDTVYYPITEANIEYPKLTSTIDYAYYASFRYTCPNLECHDTLTFRISDEHGWSVQDAQITIHTLTDGAQLTNIQTTASPIEFFRIVQNPTAETLQIAASSDLSSVRIIITNTLGAVEKAIENQSFTRTNANVIDIQSLPAGHYTVTLVSENQSQTLQFIKGGM